jgi:lipid-binding SYLF domain-containing protein
MMTRSAKEALMPSNRLLLLTALTVTLVAGAHAQTLREKMQQGVSKMRQGASEVQKGVAGATGRIEGSMDSSVDLMTNEATPQETRDELDATADETLARLFAEQPEAAKLFEASAGYAIFDTRKLILFGLAAGVGRGVAVSRTAPERRIYMNMGTAGVGMSLGLGGFESQVAILFKDEWDFDEFVTMGYDATAEAGSMLGDEKAEIGVRFVDGRAIFVLTKQGWKVSATAAGTKYWADENLN